MTICKKIIWMDNLHFFLKKWHVLSCSKEWRRSKWAFPYKWNQRGRRKREGGGLVWTLGTGVKCPRLQVGPLPLRGSCICTTRGSSPPLPASGDLNTILFLVINIIHIIHLLDGSNSKLYGGRNPSFWGHPQVVWLGHCPSLGFYLSLMPHLKITLDITNLFRRQEWVTKSIAAGLLVHLCVYLLFSELRLWSFCWLLNIHFISMVNFMPMSSLTNLLYTNGLHLHVIPWACKKQMVILVFQHCSEHYCYQQENHDRRCHCWTTVRSLSPSTSRCVLLRGSYFCSAHLSEWDRSSGQLIHISFFEDKDEGEDDEDQDDEGDDIDTKSFFFAKKS